MNLMPTGRQSRTRMMREVPQPVRRPLVRAREEARSSWFERRATEPGLLNLQPLLGNQTLQSLLDREARSAGHPGSCSCGGTCPHCSQEESIAPEHRLLSGLVPRTAATTAEFRVFRADEEEEQRAFQCCGAMTSQEPNRIAETDGQEQQGAAGIECDGSGGFRIDMGGWATAKCGIADCVRGHEQVHIDYRKAHFPDTCKNPDGTSKLAGTKPTPLPADKLKETECVAYTRELECETNLKAGATKECKKEIDDLIDDPGIGTKKMKNDNCGGC